MTDKEKEAISGYRRNGYGYTEIARIVNLSVGSIKAYCKRHGLGGVASKSDSNVSYCEQCGAVVAQIPGRKHKRFCSDRCRMLWWNSHPEKVNRNANYSYICACCGTSFISYGNRNRKYCSHECYINKRFGGE